eukprot:CAMPEP_0185777464 /NCGR_PEP_ID=MMETSP1174-20130828/89498_1 /TAXON_ID=35687 /ORGANISM="Dictyocha speculum, Strain CCMP1381" /LENGTH=88 /DNA_ID=CAMNT_0028465831 /DNA_START=17 /DNA_END=280 /DNA_ORIENTATION=-
MDPEEVDDMPMDDSHDDLGESAEEEDDDSEEEHPHDVIRNFGANEKMDGIHDALVGVLERQHASVSDELNEKNNELAQLNTKREQLGV